MSTDFVQLLPHALGLALLCLLYCCKGLIVQMAEVMFRIIDSMQFLFKFLSIRIVSLLLPEVSAHGLLFELHACESPLGFVRTASPVHG